MSNELTPEEVIKALRCDHPSLECESCEYNTGDDCNYKRMTDDAAEIIEKLQKQLPRWISVNDKLPENSKTVLCWYEYYHWSKKAVLPEYGLGYCFNGYWGGDASTGYDTKVLFWMPLPEPPKED